jgi:hypothetical protein
MSRIATAYLNIPLAQLEDFDRVKSVFARNTKAIVDNALRYTHADARVCYHADKLKIAADEVAGAYGQEDRFARAKADFIAAANDFREALANSSGSPNLTKSTEIAALGQVATD